MVKRRKQGRGKRRAEGAEGRKQGKQERKKGGKVGDGE
jgi:hypothetical protein